MGLNDKNRNQEGFSLAETLLALLILLMVSMIVANGIPVAKTAYDKVVLASNAEVLMSDTISSLRDELGTASDIKISSDYDITYYNSNTGTTSRIFRADGTQSNIPEGTIMIQRVALPAIEGLDPATIDEMLANIKLGDAVRLVSAEASTDGLFCTYSQVSYANGLLKFEDSSSSPCIKVYQAVNNHILAKKDSLIIRIISSSTGS